MNRPLFADFAELWTPVLRSSELRGRKRRAETVAGEKIVFFRDHAGDVAALRDVCPHRGVALSKGRVMKDGTLECPFHGWRFGKGGACTVIPLNDERYTANARMQAVSFPTREAGGLIWLYTAPVAQAPTEPDIPEILLDERYNKLWYSEQWETHWTRAMENMLDAAHLPYVHRYSIGTGLRRARPEQNIMDMQVEGRDYGFRATWGLRNPSAGSGAQGLENVQDSKVRLDWRSPNSMHMPLAPQGNPDQPAKMVLEQMIWCIPIDAGRTKMLHVNIHSFGSWNPLFPLFQLMNRRIFFEDRHLMESSTPKEIPTASEEACVPTDAATLTFRAYFHRHLKGSATHGERNDSERLTTDTTSLQIA